MAKLFSEPLVAPSPGVKAPSPGVKAPRGILTFNPHGIAEKQITSSLAGSESHIAVVQVRIIFSLIFAAVGLAGAVLTLWVKRNRAVLSILAMAIALLLLLPLSNQFGWELIHRLYLYALAPMAYFGALFLDSRRKTPVFVFCLLLIIGLPLHVVSHYGNQAIDYFPPGQVAGLHFFNDTTSHGYVTGAYPLGIVRNIRQYRRINFAQLDWHRNTLTANTPLKEPMPHYIGISRQDRAMCEFILDNAHFIERTEQSLHDATNCNFIYNNPDLKLYVSESY